ncbi:MAG: hypothetical protein KatS3mg102_0273 [Planctomycetota bacterium]|nr:MAG: hypothetical protein KatS3mg102_0273 [Planctomycetota bacterium]
MIEQLFGAVGALELRCEPGPEPGGTTLQAAFAAEYPPYLEDRVESWLHALARRGPVRLESAWGEGPWQPGWRAIFRGGPLGRRFWVRPPWPGGLPVPAARTPIVLDPRGAFGSGQHPTTQTVVAALEALAEPAAGQPALDVGTGSGVLAVVLAHLGYAPSALDLEPLARAACRRTAAANGVRVQVLEQGVEQLRQRFALVAANLDPQAVVTLAAELVRVLAPGGTLVLGGLRPAGIEQLLRESYASLHHRRTVLSAGGDWAALVLAAPSRSAAGASD